MESRLVVSKGRGDRNTAAGRAIEGQPEVMDCCTLYHVVLQEVMIQDN